MIASYKMSTSAIEVVDKKTMSKANKIGAHLAHEQRAIDYIRADGIGDTRGKCGFAYEDSISYTKEYMRKK
jgi:hypothetical protein